MVTYIGLFEIGLVDNGLGYTRVFENVLTEICVEFEDIVGVAALLATGRTRIRVGLFYSSTVFPC